MNQKEYLKIKKFIDNEIIIAIEKFILFSSKDFKHNVEMITEKLKQFVKPAPTFAVGDRVRVFHRYNSIIGNKGTINIISDCGNLFQIDFDEKNSNNATGIIAHKKQCRKLKKK